MCENNSVTSHQRSLKSAHTPTLDDIAALAGVSRATASRALNGKPTVNPEIAQRVRDTAERAGYRLNIAAKNLASGSTGSIALILPAGDIHELDQRFASKPLLGIISELAKRNVSAIFLDSSTADSDVNIARELSLSNVDGAIAILEAENAHLPSILEAASVPLFYIGTPEDPNPDRFSFVDMDNFMGGQVAAQALIDSGRNKIGILAGPRNYRVAQDRLEGWKATLLENGLDATRIVRSDFSDVGGARAMAELLATNEVDGVFLSSDYMIPGVMQILAAVHKRIPNDISVVSFDNSALSSIARPPLASVDQPSYKMGQMAVDELMKLHRETRVDGKAAPRKIILSPTLEMRDSL